MKKIMIFILMLFSINVNASSYIVMSMDSNTVIDGKNINSEYLIASTTKIMTAIIAIEKGNLDDKVIIDKDVLKIVGSSIYAEVGEEFLLEDLLFGLLLRSGNDAAVMIAKHIAKSEDNFVKIMNEYAKKIGMNNTYFNNSSGLDGSFKENKSSAYDMALLTSYALKNDTFKRIFKTKNYTCKSNLKTYNWKNKNKLLKYDYITGGKTGYTQKAGRTLVSTALINKENIVIVTLNDPNDFKNHLNYYKVIEKDYKKVKVIDKNEFDIKGYYLKEDVYIFIKDTDKVEVKYFLNEKKAKIFVNNLKIKEIKIYKEKKSFIEKIKEFFKW